MALRDGVVVGTQGIGARDFAIRREVSTGSWLGRAYHRQGLGTEMRAAVLQPGSALGTPPRARTPTTRRR